MSKKSPNKVEPESNIPHILQQINRHMQDINKLLALLGFCATSGPFKKGALSAKQSIGAARSYKKGRTV